MLTMPNGTEPAGGRGMGTYVEGQPTTGPGIRNQKYSTSTSVNTETYDTIKTAGGEPHNIGEVWAEMLWEVTYAMIGKYGFDADLINGTAGNERTLQLVMDGLKLQPCSPGFVDARDAILSADQADYSGADTCLIWKAFAKRGLGFSASQGSSNSSSDGTQAFDVPPACQGVTVTRTATPSPVPAGQQLTYGYQLNNVSGGTASGVTATGHVGAHATYVANSATCSGTYDSGTQTVTFPVGTMSAGATVNCQFKVQIASSPSTNAAFDDDFEPDLSHWTATHGSGAADWSLTTTTPHTPTHAAFASDPASTSDQYLTLNNPVTIASGDQLTFWHKRGLEEQSSATGYDGGVVEVSTDGGTTWSDIGAGNFVQNGYDHTISSCCSNPLAGRQAFSGTAPYEQSVANLSSLAGQSIKIRFRVGTDSSVGAAGWTVDDVFIGSLVETTSTGTVAATGFPTQTADVTTRIDPVAGTVPGAPAVTGETPSAGAVTCGVQRAGQ